jgi:transposase InsO family protein
MDHVREAPYHPVTQGKIERWHRTIKNVVKLENYYSPDELKAAIAEFVAYYNQERYHESVDNMTTEDVYYGRLEEVKTRREKIKRKTLRERKRLHRLQFEGV